MPQTAIEKLSGKVTYLTVPIYPWDSEKGKITSTESVLLSRLYMRIVKLSVLSLIMLNRYGGEYFYL